MAAAGPRRVRALALLARSAEARLDMAAAELSRMRAEAARLDAEIAALGATRGRPSTAFVVETGRYAGDFLRGVRAEEARLAERREALSRRIDIAERHVGELFAERRKAEATRDHVRRGLDAAEARRTEAATEEAALGQWRRQQR